MEQLAARAGSAIGGLLNVTFGNAAGMVSLALRVRDRRRQRELRLPFVQARARRATTTRRYGPAGLQSSKMVRALRRGFCLAVCVVHAASQ
jgi:hypothetical protein